MKPYGREKKIKGGKPWKIDHHPQKGFVNWWENMCDFFSRSRMKHDWKKTLKNEIENKY
jgi:hypothetical protein